MTGREEVFIKAWDSCLAKSLHGIMYWPGNPTLTFDVEVGEFALREELGHLSMASG